MTQEFLQDALVADLEQLFKGETLKNSAGVERQIRVYPQDVPIRAGADTGEDLEPVEDVDRRRSSWRPGTAGGNRAGGRAGALCDRPPAGRRTARPG